MQKRKIDELISHFNRKVADMDIDREYKMELLGMITAIGIACEKELSIEPERMTWRWIPCSERLPEIGQSVLLSVGGMYSAEGCLREDGDWAQFRWDAIQRKDMVGAWKPLPEPYKGEQE